MKNHARVFALFILLFLILTTPIKVSAAENSDWQAGLTLRLTNESKEEVDASLEGMKAVNSNYMIITPGWLTDSETSSNVYRKSRTPSDDLLIYTIDKAHSMGMNVMIKPHIDINNGPWRAFIDPNDKSTFFKNYSDMIVHYAKISQDHNVEMFSIGAELYKLTTNSNNESYWRDLIKEVRSVYDGKVTYAATASSSYYDETSLPFWDALDYVGLDLYRKLSDNKDPTYDEIISNWQKVEDDFMIPLKERVNKPILLTEVGYRSIDGAAMEPENYQNDGAVDLKEQELLYKALFEFWKDKTYLEGIHIWDWKAYANPGGPDDNDFTAQNKPAEAVLTKYFGELTASNVSNTADTTSPKNMKVYIKGNSVELSNNFSTGSRFYEDRDYDVQATPDYLNGLDYVKTKNGDKYYSGDSYITIELDASADIYVAFDSRVNSLPNWLQNWVKQSDQIQTSDVSYDLYKKDFSAGTVTLAGNNANGMSGAGSNYFVLIEKTTEITNLKIKGDSIETVEGIANGSRIYHDRDYYIKNLVSELTSGKIVRTYNSDKYNTSDSYITFTLGSTADVYVAYDERVSNIPSWLTNWEKTDITVETSDVGFRLYKKQFSSQDVSLAGNRVSSSSDNASNYFVVVKSR